MRRLFIQASSWRGAIQPAKALAIRPGQAVGRQTQRQFTAATRHGQHQRLARVLAHLPGKILPAAQRLAIQRQQAVAHLQAAARQRRWRPPWRFPPAAAQATGRAGPGRGCRLPVQPAPPAAGQCCVVGWLNVGVMALSARPSISASASPASFPRLRHSLWQSPRRHAGPPAPLASPAVPNPLPGLIQLTPDMNNSAIYSSTASSRLASGRRRQSPCVG